MMKKKTLSSHDVAKYCDIAPRTAAQWIREGKMKAYRTPGSHFRVKIEDFLCFLSEYNMPIPDELATTGNVRAKKRILIVDDDRNMALSIQRILTLQDQYELELAFDGFAAGRKIVLFKPDLVILDIRMPGPDGYAIVKSIKETPELSKTKVIAISAFFEEEGKKSIRLLGADECLDKPFDKEHLLKTIQAILSQRDTSFVAEEIKWRE
jgi:two-component system, OmpR family, response regulator VicR